MQLWKRRQAVRPARLHGKHGPLAQGSCAGVFSQGLSSIAPYNVGSRLVHKMPFEGKLTRLGGDLLVNCGDLMRQKRGTTNGAPYSGACRLATRERDLLAGDLHGRRFMHLSACRRQSSEFAAISALQADFRLLEGEQLFSNVREVASQHLRQMASQHLRQV